MAAYYSTADTDLHHYYHQPYTGQPSLQPQAQEYLSTLTTFRHSFDLGYSTTTMYPRGDLDAGSEHLRAGDTDHSSDSGVPSDTMDDFSSDLSPSSGLHTPTCLQEYLAPGGDTGGWHQEGREDKPLSAWKLKQLRLTPAGIRKRRRDANNRERKRMNGLNEAFERLREAVPGSGSEAGGGAKKLSKMETLQMAQLYIRHLATLLSQDQDQTPH